EEARGRDGRRELHRDGVGSRLRAARPGTRRRAADEAGDARLSRQRLSAKTPLQTWSGVFRLLCSSGAVASSSPACGGGSRWGKLRCSAELARSDAAARSPTLPSPAGGEGI